MGQCPGDLEDEGRDAVVALVGTVYGMNFTYMPELDERWGYPVALGLMLTTSLVLFAVFRSRRWL